MITFPARADIEHTVDFSLFSLRTMSIKHRLQGELLCRDALANWLQGKIDGIYDAHKYCAELPDDTMIKLMSAKHEANFLLYGYLREI